MHQFSSVAQSCPTLRPLIAALQASLSTTNSRSSLKLMSIESVIPSSHLILCRPLLLICIEMNENENTTTQNLWDTVKAVLRRRFIAIQVYLKKQEKSQINNLTLQLKQLEKEEMKNPRVSRRKEILKIRE